MALTRSNVQFSNHVQILVSEYDIFDYGGGEPAPHIRTVLRELKVRLPFHARSR